MVDRTMVNVGQIPLDTDILQPQRNMMIAVGALAQAVIGQQNANPAVAVDGFALTATSSPSLVLNVGPGSIYQVGVVDQTAYGSLAADITDSITQQGIALSTQSLTFTPPGTVGFSTNYLIQVGLSVQDGSPVVLDYFDAANPAVPWLGPNNTSVAQNTIRKCAAVVQAKAGVAATSGSQITPAPDPGFYGIYSVTVANGATALTSGNFSALATAPFIPAPLMAIPQAVQSGKWVYAPDTGTANALIVTLSPAPLALVAGLVVRVKKSAAVNTGASTLVVNGSAAISITTITGAALIGNEMPASSMLDFRYDGANFQLQSAVSTAQVALMHFGDDATGTANAMVVTSVYPPVASVVQGMHFTITKGDAANTGALSATIMGTTAPVTWPDLTPFSGGEWAAEADGLVVYDGNYRLLGPTTPFSFVVPGAPPPLLAPRTYYVNAGTGSDSNSGLSSGNAFASVQKAITVTQSLNMNGFNVTINVDGTIARTYAPFVCGALNGSGLVTIVGNLTTPSNVLIHATSGEAALVNAPGYTLSGLAFQSDAAGTAPHLGIGIRAQAVVFVENCSFGACFNAHIWIDPSGQVICAGAGNGFPSAFINITGNAPYHVQFSGVMQLAQTILNITGTITFTAFSLGQNFGLMLGPYSAINITGSVTGSKYSLTAPAIINTNGAGTSYFPGSTSGTSTFTWEYL
jgi:hypothetical protein